MMSTFRTGTFVPDNSGTSVPVWSCGRAHALDAEAPYPKSDRATDTSSGARWAIAAPCLASAPLTGRPIPSNDATARLTDIGAILGSRRTRLPKELQT